MNKYKLFIRASLITSIVLLVDLSNIDNLLYQIVCHWVNSILSTVCVNYYDMPIWQVGVTIGTLTAAYYAYAGIRESNKRLEIEQSPHVVLRNGVGLTGDNSLHNISLTNTGKGRAINITATTDPAGRISIIESSNPNSVELKGGESNTSWAIDEGQVVRGLLLQGKHVSRVMSDIPDEMQLGQEEKEKADFFIFLWYEDQLGNKYKTTTTIRHSGYFLKIMHNKVEKI